MIDYYWDTADEEKTPFHFVVQAAPINPCATVQQHLYTHFTILIINTITGDDGIFRME